MRHYKKTALVIATLSVMSWSLSAATADKTIYVTTFADDDGSDPTTCSLREAVVTASTGRAYGGCKVGEVWPTRANTIQLQEGEYQLKTELQPTQAIIILGKDPVDYTKPNVLTNDYPAATAVKTRIRAVGNNRIINSTLQNNPDIVLNNVDLYDGFSSDKGGAILAGGGITLNNVSIYNSKAQRGGAIFLDGVKSSFVASHGQFQGNQAEQGSVLAMTCTNNLDGTKRDVLLDYMSIFNNGSATSQSGLAYCGMVNARISASSIGLNQADPAKGSIIQFSSKTPYGEVPLNTTGAKLNLLSNTIVQNTAFSTLLYNYDGLKELKFNVLAFNQSNGKSCRYADNLEGVTNANLILQNNALILNRQEDGCDFPTDSTETVKKDNVALDQYQFNQILYPLSQNAPNEYTSFMPMYFANVATENNPIIDSKAEAGCSGFDQRGLKRVNVLNNVGGSEKPNTCDIGATEVLRLTAANISALNDSVVKRLEGYQKNVDDFEILIKNPQTNPEYLPYYRLQVDKYRKLVDFTKQHQKYRTIFVDPFSTNLPDETVTSDGVREIKHLNAQTYTVKVEALGVGRLGSDQKFQGRFDPDLRCEWNADLEQVLMYRLDDRITPQGDTEFCSYELSMKGSNPLKSSSAYIMSSFRNIAPYAKSVSYNFAQGSTDWIELKLLENTHDDGDGDVRQLKNGNKLSYYTDGNGQDLAIRMSKVRDPVEISAERSGPCPGDPKLTCYGGKIQARLKNTLDPFSYDLTYVVYDAEGEASEEATIQLKNSGSAPGSTSGGGAVGWLGLSTLAVLVWLRRRQDR